MKRTTSTAIIICASASAATSSHSHTNYSNLKDQIAKALSAYEHADVEVHEVTEEVRSGKRVACGTYRHRSINGPFLVFGWVNGKLVKKFGPDINPATICLFKHYGGPLP